MPPRTVTPRSLIGRLFILSQAIFAVAFSISGSVAAHQASDLTPVDGAASLNWKKSINREYGFSVRYPDTYRLTDAEGRCKDNDDVKFLVCLERPDNTDEKILIYLSADPFRLRPGNVMPVRQKIGHHVFYVGFFGSAGSGMADYYQMNLKDKTLAVLFSDDARGQPSDETRRLEKRLSNTLRTF